MKKGIGTRGIFILIVLGLSLWSLWPSIQVHKLTGEDKKEFMKHNTKVVSKAVNFGLDLAGGTNIVVEIDKSNLKPDEAEDAQSRSLEIIRNRVEQFGLSEPISTKSGENRIIAELAGVDVDQVTGLIGETALLEFKLVAPQERFVQILNTIDESLQRRTAGITVEDSVAGEEEEKDDASRFFGDDILADTQSTADSAQVAIADSVAQDSTQAQVADSATDSNQIAVADSSGDSSQVAALVADSVATDTEIVTDRFTEDLATFKQRPFSSMLMSFGGDVAVRESDVERIIRTLVEPSIAALIPHDVQFAWGRGFEELSNGDKVKKLYLLRRRAEMDGKEISDAHPHRISDGFSAGQLAVNMKFKGIGPKKFASVTGNNVGRQMAIVLDDQVVSAPVIRDRIADGNAQITGIGDMNEAKQLAVVLRAGALPAPMEVIELRSVGASLGEDNIRNGVFAAVVGVSLVLLFMIIYYRTAGLIASAAVLFNMVIVGAVMSMFNATLTLPGIAGIVLTVGMAVDANVIIYERIREELRAGRTARAGLAAGYEKAFSSIFDSNVTTFLTAFILYKIGAGPVKGFGLTLMVGIASSMFTALVATRSIFEGILARNNATKINVGKGLDALINANLPIIPKRKVFMTISGVLLVAAIALIAVKGFQYSIDFTGGHVLTVQYEDEGNHVEELQNVLSKESLPTASVRNLYGTQANQYMISLQSDGSTSTDARSQLEEALQKHNIAAKIVNEDIVGPSIGKELRNDAILAVFIAMLIIIMYIWVRFGKNGLGFGVSAVIALMHDVVIALGIFSLLGISIDTAMIAAILTIVGYSLNDTIVIFDRVRENSENMGRESFESVVNRSINSSLSRTIITSLTTFFVTAVLAWRGGSSIQSFGIAMSVGVILGTWSSNAVASPMVTWWTRRFSKGR